MKRNRREADLSDEVQAHLEMATRDGIERGLSPDDARAAALREFGNVPLIQQTTREMWSWTRVEQLWQDLRFGARILWHSPGLSATAIVLIALVIGGNTTVYSIVNGMLVSPAIGVTSERLVVIKHVEPGAAIADPFISFPNYEDYARLSTTVQALAGWSDERLTLGTDAGNYAVFGGLVTTNYFDVFGVGLVLGRGLRADDDASRDGVVAVISDRLWRERFGQVPDVIGRAVRINNVPATIVGVTAPGFAGPLLTPGDDVWLPIRSYYRAIGSTEILRDRARPVVAMVGQRIPTASSAEVRAEFNSLAAQLRAAFPESFTTQSPRGIIPMRNPRVTVAPYAVAALSPAADMAPRFLALFSIVTLLTLLVVSANVANLMLGRAVERQRDTAVRRSLGASRLRVVRMLAAEGAAIAIVAWFAACLFAWWTSRALLRMIEPQPGLLAEIRPDWTLAAYAMLLAAAATLTFTIAPALRAWKQQVLPLLKNGEQSVARGRSRLSNILVVFQLAFSVLLLTSAGLAYRSLSMMDSGDVGFDADDLLLVTVRAGRQAAYATTASTDADRAADLLRLERVRERLAQESGVIAAGYGRRVPGAFFLGTTLIRGGMNASVNAFVRPVGPHYLRALGLVPLEGRELSPADRRGATPVAVVNQRLAQELFPAASAVGQTVQIGDRGVLTEIVGVVPNALVDGPVHDPHPRYVFTAQQQVLDAAPIDMTFFVRYETTLEAMTPVVGRVIAEVDAALPIVSMATMRSRLAQVTVLERQLTTLLVAFAIGSLLVAALGQYAVAMFNMRRRTRDFGIRLALGASSRQLEGRIVAESLRLTLTGLLIGFVLSVAAGIAFRTVLFGVTPVDPPTYVAVLLLLAAASIVASYLPAWRAGRVNVVEALRQD